MEQLTRKDKKKASLIEDAVNEYFQTCSQAKVSAKELMDFFIKKDIFSCNYRDGLPIRNFLRKLDKYQQLHLIVQAYYEQKPKYKYWFFINPSN